MSLSARTRASSGNGHPVPCAGPLCRRADRITSPLKWIGLLMIAWPLVFGFMVALRMYDWIFDLQQKAMGIIDALSDGEKPKEVGLQRDLSKKAA